MFWHRKLNYETRVFNIIFDRALWKISQNIFSIEEKNLDLIDVHLIWWFFNTGEIFQVPTIF